MHVCSKSVQILEEGSDSVRRVEAAPACPPTRLPRNSILSTERKTPAWEKYLAPANPEGNGVKTVKPFLPAYASGYGTCLFKHHFIICYEVEKRRPSDFSLGQGVPHI